MNTALALAFSAGMVATINPCGFAMLPAYLSYFMGISDDARTRPQVLRSALAVGGVVSAGFVVVFGIAGIIISAGFRTLATTWIPWLALAIGILIAILGLAMIGGYELRALLPKAGRASTGGGWSNVFAFGASYGIASLSCTLPVFLIAVATQLTQRSFAEGLLVFLAYTAGMSAMLLGITIVLALGKQTLLQRLRASARYINRVSGVILVAAGAFIVWFWATELSSGATALGRSATFRLVERIQSTIQNFIADNIGVVAVVAGALVLATAAYVLGRPQVRTEESGGEDAMASVAGGGPGREV